MNRFGQGEIRLPRTAVLRRRMTLSVRRPRRGFQSTFFQSTIATAGALLLLAGCGGLKGTCVTSGCDRSQDEQCYARMTHDECTDFDTRHVNGCHWAGSANSCEGLGFTYACYEDSLYTRSKSTCGY